jgi:glycosyltransferase involved in cell wall biosynthesis
MKIGFDISQTGKQKAGCGYFADSLARHLAEIDPLNEYILYPTFGDSFWDPDWASGTYRLRQANFHNGLGHKTFETAKVFWSHPPEDLESQLGDPDIVHSNNFFCPQGLRKARLVYTLYDLSFLVHPEWTTEENRTACFQGVFQASLYADLIISISHYSRNHFLEVFPHYSENRIVVAHPASRFSNSVDIRPPSNLPALVPGQFWLNVGVFEPRKNQERLLRSYDLLKKELGKTYPLVFAGGSGWLMENFEKKLDELHLRQDVIFLGYVENETLQWLYKNCFAFLYPSLFEGFGMPVLEAMSLGAPVIASKVTSLPEITGDAALLIDPTREGEICQAMRRLAVDPQVRFDLMGRSSLQASKFSWHSTASTVLQAYQQVASRPPLFPRHPPGGAF